jgi:hypothetical protein
MGDQRGSRRGRPDYRSRGGIRNSLRNFPRNSRFWENFKIMAIDVHTVEDGKIKRTYHVEDWAGAMRQLSGGA